MTLQSRLSRAIGETLAEADAEERKYRPRRERLEAFRQSTPRVVIRIPRDRYFGGRARYETIRLGDVRYIENYANRGRPAILVGPAGGRVIAPEELDELVRIPKAAALRRIEEQEEIIREATAELQKARRAAFTYGRTIPVRRTREMTRGHKEAFGEE